MWSSPRTWRGIAAVAVGLIAVVWPDITVGAFVIVFAVHCFMSAANDATTAFQGDRTGPVVGHLLLSFIAFVTGVTALVWPGITVLTLAVWIAVWAVVAGLLEIGFALRRGVVAGTRARWAVSGSATLAFGLVLAMRPDTGALTLATLFGFYAIVYGASIVAMAWTGGTDTPPRAADHAVSG